MRTVRKFISVVPQESILFDGTVKENIAYGLKNLSDQALSKALKDANAFDFVNQLPEGVNTLVGDRGAKLSGGQKQRLAIARALIRNPKILILDEATSSLDAAVERDIHDALSTLRQARTTLLIAHRIATVRDADAIIVIDEGRIVERGTHASLLTHRGIYARLWELQQGADRAGQLDTFPRLARAV